LLRRYTALQDVLGKIRRCAGRADKARGLGRLSAIAGTLNALLLAIATRRNTRDKSLSERSAAKILSETKTYSEKENQEGENKPRC
jgi:hypothetical protein